MKENFQRDEDSPRWCNGCLEQKLELYLGKLLEEVTLKARKHWAGEGRQGNVLQTGSSMCTSRDANLFCKGPDSKYFRLYSLPGLCCNYSAIAT